MSLLNTLERIFEKEIGEAENRAFERGRRHGYYEGICIAMIAAAIGNFLVVAPFLGQQTRDLIATNLSKCLTVWPQESCSAYCNSPAFLR
jgi:hypothetical protein